MLSISRKKKKALRSIDSFGKGDSFDQSLRLQLIERTVDLSLAVLDDLAYKYKRDAASLHAIEGTVILVKKHIDNMLMGATGNGAVLTTLQMRNAIHVIAIRKKPLSLDNRLREITSSVDAVVRAQVVASRQSAVSYKPTVGKIGRLAAASLLIINSLLSSVHARSIQEDQGPPREKIVQKEKHGVTGSKSEELRKKCRALAYEFISRNNPRVKIDKEQHEIEHDNKKYNFETFWCIIGENRELTFLAFTSQYLADVEQSLFVQKDLGYFQNLFVKQKKYCGVGPMEKLAEKCKAETLQKTIKNVVAFTSKHMRYYADHSSQGYKETTPYSAPLGNNHQIVKSPSQFLIDGGGDCEDYAILINSVLAQLGYKTYLVLGKCGDDYHAICGVRVSNGHTHTVGSEKIYFFDPQNGAALINGKVGKLSFVPTMLFNEDGKKVVLSKKN